MQNRQSSKKLNDFYNFIKGISKEFGKLIDENTLDPEKFVLIIENNVEINFGILINNI